ncbi:MAG: class I SAM-dependent methyltransferase [bacterium]|nr:class I SAM-dependent methyltransferase [bacterium]
MTYQILLNKTMDRADLQGQEAQTVLHELNELIRKLRKKNLNISSWYGYFSLPPVWQHYETANRGFNYQALPEAIDDRHFPWFLYWEIAWVVINNHWQPGMRVLDLGGSSSLFSYYLASKGLEVTTVDLQPELVDNANRVAAAMGWRLNNLVMDMRHLTVPGPFDHITSICVYEHLPWHDRVAVNQEVRRLLMPRGNFSITFDYRNPSQQARISSPDDVAAQFIAPSGLVPRGNLRFHDSGSSHLLHPFFSPNADWRWKLQSIRRREFRLTDWPKKKFANDYTFGALFLTQPTAPPTA